MVQRGRYQQHVGAGWPAHPAATGEKLKKLQLQFHHLHQFGHQLDLQAIKESMQKFRLEKSWLA